MNEKEIRTGLLSIENPGRFHWLSPTLLVDTANNAENIHILATMIKKLNYKRVITLFGTTQIDKKYARVLADMIPAEKRFIIDNFCDRALPSSEYGKQSDKEQIIDLAIVGQEWLMSLQKQKNTLIVVYGSFYLVGEIMRLSRYKPFATE